MSSSTPAMMRAERAPTEECGKGSLARMNQCDMDRLQLTAGDIVTITGARLTVSRLCSASPEVQPREVQLSEVCFANTMADLGSEVAVGKIDNQPAQHVTLIPLSEDAGAPAPISGVRKWLVRPLAWIRPRQSNPPCPALQGLLDGVPLLRQDRVQVEWSGRVFHYQVKETVPGGVVVSDRATTFTIVHPGEDPNLALSYGDIGGLRREVARVREMVELPMRSPQVFQHLGIEPPKGLLMYGPPGCGKTLIARAVARESGAHFINVNGPEIIQKHYGESEELLRDIFAEAQKYQPSIIFFDEIDAVAPSRESVLGDVEKRVVAQLLALMDGLNARGQIVVIAATNLPNNVDPALRRPGRLDREISINPPDKAGRLEILRIHSRNMPLAPDVDLPRLSEITHGFLGADLAALCREAAMGCARESQMSSDLSSGTLGYVCVKMVHFETALAEIDLSTTRQVSTEIPSARWDEVGGLDEAKQILRQTVEWPLKYSERFEFARTSPPRGILLTGLPGTGKTLLARALASETEVNFISVKGPELLSKWVGESERGIREVFRKARQSAPSIIFFDEIDAIAPTRGKDDGASNIGERMVGQMLLEMDSLENIPGVVVLAATNRPELLDSALRRPGRFDLVVNLPMPDMEGRHAILVIHCRGRQLAADVNLCDLASATAGTSGAEVEAVCSRAAILAIGDSIAEHPGKDFAPFSVSLRHFQQALAEVAGGNKLSLTPSKFQETCD